jgi:hypothetical protein
MVPPAPEPPALHQQGFEHCIDASRARSAALAALSPARAPASRESTNPWSVVLSFARVGNKTTLVAEIRDHADEPRARRELAGTRDQCTALVRGAMVWVQLTLEAEVERDQAAPEPAPLPVEPTVAMWPAPAAPVVRSPEHEMFLAHDDRHRTIEIGGGGFVMGGLGTGGVTGPNLFGIVELGRGWYARPTLAFGRSFEQVGTENGTFASVAEARLDGCKRVPGNYFERRGLQLDLCAGVEGGTIHFDESNTTNGAPQTLAGRSLGFLSTGGAVGMRGELGSDWSVHLRGTGGYNLLRQRVVDEQGTAFGPLAWNARAEVGLSWRLR